MTPGNNNPGDNGVNGDTLDNMKHSPGTAPNTPRDGEPNMDFNMSNFSQPGNSVSVSFLQKFIKNKCSK